MRVALLETDEEVAHMNHMAANPVSDAPPPAGNEVGQERYKEAHLVRDGVHPAQAPPFV